MEQGETELTGGGCSLIIRESALTRTLKWAIVHAIHPNESGLVREVTVRYMLVNGSRQSYVSRYHKKGPFKYRREAIQNLSIMYSKQEQEADRTRNLADPLAGSANVGIVTKDIAEGSEHNGGGVPSVAAKIFNILSNSGCTPTWRFPEASPATSPEAQPPSSSAATPGSPQASCQEPQRP
jgi:hypothetical protein